MFIGSATRRGETKGKQVKNIFKLRVRIVRDGYSGYEVQTRRWWFPFWLQGRVNTHARIEDAERYAKKFTDHIVRELQ